MLIVRQHSFQKLKTVKKSVNDFTCFSLSHTVFKGQNISRIRPVNNKVMLFVLVGCIRSESVLIFDRVIKPKFLKKSLPCY